MVGIRVALTGGFVLAMGLVAGPAALQAYSQMQYEATLTATPNVVRPNAVTFSSVDQSLCVTDEGSPSLVVFDDLGFHRFSTNRISGVSSPQGGCIDADGDFIFTGRGVETARTIKRLNFLGEPDTYEPETPASEWSPMHLVIAEDGTYIALDEHGLLTRHDPVTGKLIWKSQVMDRDAEFVDLMGRPAQAPDGRIYIPDSGGAAVIVVSPQGRLLTTFGESGSKRGTFAFPVGVAFGPDDRILVLDRMRHRVLVFDTNHAFVTEFGRLGYGRGELYHPVAITASSDGRVWIAQGYQGRVQMFRLRDSESIPGTSNTPSPLPNHEGEK